jgi:hypothetical protein
MENILTGEPSTTVLLKQSDSRKDALRGPNTQCRKSKNPFLIGLNRAFSTKTHEVLPLAGALRNRKTNFLTTFRPPASSQMKNRNLFSPAPEIQMRAQAPTLKLPPIGVSRVTDRLAIQDT